MTDSIEKIRVSGEGLTVSRLIWNRFQRPVPGLLGQIYDLNPGLALHGIEIPVGTTILIPVPDGAEVVEVVDRVTLWG